MPTRRLLTLRVAVAVAGLAASARAAAAQGTNAAPAAPAAVALPAIAPGDSASVPAVERLLAASDAERAYNQAVALSVAAQTRANPALAEQADVLRAFVARHASYGAIRADLIRVYRETFTAREVAELTQFYSSDLGRRMSAKLPLATARTNELLSARLQANLPELVELIQARLRQRPGGAPPGGT